MSRPDAVTGQFLTTLTTGLTCSFNAAQRHYAHHEKHSYLSVI